MPDAILHGIDEFLVRPTADAGRQIRRDVRREQDAERRFQGATACERLAASRRVASAAVCRRRHVAAVLDHLKRLLVRVLRTRCHSAKHEQREGKEVVSEYRRSG